MNQVDQTIILENVNHIRALEQDRQILANVPGQVFGSVVLRAKNDGSDSDVPD